MAALQGVKPRALQAALRKITETLASELACPTQGSPDWSDFEWLIARAVAAMHGVSPLLSRALHWPGPAGWVDFLEEQRAHTSRRHARIDELLLKIDRLTRKQGVAAMALKGAALHSVGLYAGGERPMADVDLLVRPQDAERTARLIQSLGFHESRTNWKERVFTPADDRAAASLGEHADNNIKIELHERIREGLPRQIADVSELIFPSRPQPGLNAYPSRAALMIHLLLHAAGSTVIQSLRLIQLHDVALLARRMEAADWNEVLEYRSKQRLWWALPPLQLTARYYSSTVPVCILRALKLDCPWHLERIYRERKLSDVSYSHLWVDAFPGIEWSRSVPEMLKYTVSRVRPSAKHIALRDMDAKTEGWASSDEWSRLSQSRRILRWVTSRPTRPVTMHVVRAALAHAL
jgi:hypothetical protein